MKNKIIIISAPSGSGKTTIVKHLLSIDLFNLTFSISATNRNPRNNEVNGVDYFFLTTEEFKTKIQNNEFLEWQEVYTDRFYGSLKKVEDFLPTNNLLFDVDVVGGYNIKKHYGDRALSIFIKPPSIQILERRLIDRKTDDSETIKKRVEKAAKELEYEHLFDVSITNDILEKALNETSEKIKYFLNL